MAGGCGALAVGCDSGWGAERRVFSLCGGLVSPSAVHHVFCSCVCCVLCAVCCVLCAVCVCYLLYVVPDCATTMMALLAPDGRAGLARTAGVGRKWAVLVVCVVCMVAVCAAALRC